MRRLTALTLALLLSLLPLAAISENAADSPVQALTAFVQRALGGYNSLTYQDDEGDAYFTLVFESTNGRMGDLYVYLDVFPSGILIDTCYDTSVPEDHAEEVVRFINMINADLLGSKYYLYGDTIYYEYYVMMDFADMGHLDARAEALLDDILTDTVAEADYDAEYFAEIIAGESAKNAYAMYLADLDSFDW